MNAARPEDIPAFDVERRKIESGAYAAVAYRDVFRFPMTAAEIHRCVQGLRCTRQEVDGVLESEAMENLLVSDGTYYGLRGREACLKTRTDRKDICEEAWQQAMSYASVLAMIPTIRMIGVTGSLANNNAREGDDIDFMVITEPGCLWRTRACVKLLQQLDYRFGQGRLCVNYLRSEAALEIDDRCTYIAQEIVQLVPVYGMETYWKFRRSNAWTNKLLPNAAGPPSSVTECKPRSTLLHKFGGPFIRSGAAARIEAWECARKLKLYNDTDYLPGRYTRFTAEATGHRLAVRDAAEASFECRMRILEGPARPLRLLFGQAYHLSFDKKLWDEMRPFPPLGCLYAAAVARKAGHEVHFSDSMVSTTTSAWADSLHRLLPDVAVLYEDNFNYLTKMCLSTMRDAAITMMRMSARHDVPVIVCSSDATDNVDLYLDSGARFVILGEGEDVLADLLKLLAGRKLVEAEKLTGLAFRDANGKTIVNPRRAPMRRIDSLPEPAWDLVDWQHYRSLWATHHGRFAVNVVTTRGCPYHCNWCAKPIWGQSYQARSAESVAREIAELHRLALPDYIWFMDDIFGLKPGWISRFADEMSKRGLHLPFKCLSRPDILLRQGEIDALHRAGCDVVWMGAESGSQKILDAMEKGTTVQQIETATRELKSRGIRVGHFIQFGYPGEEAGDITATLQLLRKTLPDELGISVTYPLPGTKFFDRVVAQLGNKRNWVDSDDLAILFNSPYSTRFYRVLHRHTHHYLAFYRNVKNVVEKLRGRASDNVSLARSMAHILNIAPRLSLTWLRLKLYRRTDKCPSTIVEAELSPEEAAAPSRQI